ncbi:M23 family metallopeptidase [Pilimelia columellifera]|uniref:M23ase beta-sheet core domain-containing protein n=1 Tax=Pilimelia columellifera subsp. columellifera TaxID=706583 RepID=A0ABP6AQB2_9ACTN
MKHRATSTSRHGRHSVLGQGLRRPPTMERGLHRAPTFGGGAHRAPIELQVGQTATAAVFGVAAAAVALGSASAAAPAQNDENEAPLLDAASNNTDDLQDALAARESDAASRGDERAEAPNPAAQVKTQAGRALTKPVAKPATIKPVTAKTTAKTPRPVAKAAKPAVRTVRARTVNRGYAHPMPGAAVTSCFGQRWGTLHAGIDFAKPSGTPIQSVKAGRVVAAGWNYGGYGISVMVKHDDGYLTHYAHMSRKAVQAGQRVAAGQTLGYEGSTGDSTGPHLHFEVHKGMWNQVNPTGWLRARGVNISC